MYINRAMSGEKAMEEALRKFIEERKEFDAQQSKLAARAHERVTGVQKRREKKTPDEVQARAPPAMKKGTQKRLKKAKGAKG